MLIFGVVVVLGLVFWVNGWKRETYVLVSGKQGAGYHSFAKGLASLRNDGGLMIDVHESEGSLENIRSC